MKGHHKKLVALKKKNRGRRHTILFCFASLLWFIFRTGTKPSRIVYPCQRMAIANSSLLLGLSFPLWVTSVYAKTKSFISMKWLTGALLISLLITVLSGEQFLGGIQLGEAANSNQEINLTLNSRTSIYSPSSDIYVVNGREYAHISELINLMSSHGLRLYKSDTVGENMGPDGLIAYDDLVLIKINSQWAERGGTNTDLLKEFIQLIVDHPDGFVGEIIVADNGQAQYGSTGNGGSLNWANNNAEDTSQSAQDVVDMFAGSHNVSTYLWDTITLENVGEYSEGDINDGYVVNQTINTLTGIKVSYPKFKTEFGTHVSFKEGIWNPVTQTYNSESLKVINFPVLKSHGGYGVTASTKHYMGVVSAKQTNAHAKVATGGMGTQMVETRFPTLNILDAIWVNANPLPSSSVGPSSSYGTATRVNTIMASTDPIALSYWGSKNVLMQTAKSIGYTNTDSINPDNTDPSNVWGEVFGRWLDLSKNAIFAANYNVTKDENHMNVYVKSEQTITPVIDAPSQNPSGNNVMVGEEVKVSVSVSDAESEVKNVTLSFTVNNGVSWENSPMNYNASTSLYEAIIPGQAAETLVKFKIIAYNNAGKSAVKDNAGEYYTYNVIPEFVSWIILPLFLIATLFATIIKKRFIH